MAYINAISQLDENGRPEWDAEIVPDLETRLLEISNMWEERATLAESEEDPTLWAEGQVRASVYHYCADIIRREIGYGHATASYPHARRDIGIDSGLDGDSRARVEEYGVPQEDGGRVQRADLPL